ncbi:hypothetical protein KC332_g2244 [Hortaea werneckii]|nr:hypothetical protein KC350_g4866 [Hortaea werneckii]KAI6847750.1 hypothetical protein KC358_g2171 [Hortaea werneckii]KAI6927412.1 hypothetical protein KC341_g12135 [Hortaea werneckii]KAI6935889.1 hypothetical protein KC348_g6161 [Hortaea werneckii]KAI6980029.1 hypothetical protein KC321_g2011 [Hortaea werneckii]
MEQSASSSGKFLSRLRGQKGEQRSGEQQQQKQKQEPRKLDKMTNRFSRSSSAKTANAKKTPAHQVLIGRGGTTNTFFPHPGHVAFTSLDNGVGVFFKIDYNRCFAAHIYARVHVVVPGGGGNAAAASAPDVVASRDQALRYITRELVAAVEQGGDAPESASGGTWGGRSRGEPGSGCENGGGRWDAEVVGDGGGDGSAAGPQGRAFVVDGMGGEVERQQGELGEDRWDLVPVKAKIGGWRIRVGVEAAEQQ